MLDVEQRRACSVPTARRTRCLHSTRTRSARRIRVNGQDRYVGRRRSSSELGRAAPAASGRSVDECIFIPIVDLPRAGSATTNIKRSGGSMEIESVSSCTRSR